MREAANALIRVHKASTQNQKLRTKTSKISMSQRDNRKSCHSDQFFHTIDDVRGMIWERTAGCRRALLDRAAAIVVTPRRFPQPWTVEEKRCS
jgi:hypothetical protein